MRAAILATLVATVALVSACAPKAVPEPPSGAARFPDFIRPTAPATIASGPAVLANDRAWQYLQAGDLRAAERESTAALKQQPTLYPAQTTAGYVALAKNDAAVALERFSRVVEAHAEYVPALVGKGLVLASLNRAAEAAEAFRAALEFDPSLVEIARRVEVLTLRGLQDELAAAAAAARAGDTGGAIRAYRNAIAASPDSAFLYRELAALERGQGQLGEAAAHLRRAHALDAADVASLVLLGDVLAEQDDVAGAMAAYGDAQAIEFEPSVEAKRSALRARLDLAAMPEQYRAIEKAPQVTRAELAALIGVRLAPLVLAAPVQDIGVLTDLRGQWAERWIAPVARAGIMEAFPNHAFQPRTVVRRVDLAQTTAKLLAVVGTKQPTAFQGWSVARPRFVDMPATHLAYPAASIAVTAGIMQAADGAFQPTRPVTGAEAIATIERIQSLAGLAGSSSTDRR